VTGVKRSLGDSGRIGRPPLRAQRSGEAGWFLPGKEPGARGASRAVSRRVGEFNTSYLSELTGLNIQGEFAAVVVIQFPLKDQPLVVGKAHFFVVHDRLNAHSDRG
jgi:hypothetical protein